jgi:hypothetical protein
MIPQQTINIDPAPGVAGDFCSANPRFSMLAGPGALVAAAAGLIAGRFGWAKDSDGTVSNAHPGAPSRVGFVGRNQNAFLATIPFTAGATVPGGYEVTLFDSADVWMLFAAGATRGQKVFASYADGTAVAGTAGSAPTATGDTVTTTNGSPNRTAVAGGTLVPGQPISGTGVPAGAYIVSVNGATAVMSANATAAGTGVAITQTTAFETAWFVDQTVNAGEIAKTSTRG